jgi:hypothetical protein
VPMGSALGGPATGRAAITFGSASRAAAPGREPRPVPPAPASSDSTTHPHATTGGKLR